MEGLDSENGGAASCFEWPLTPRLLARPRVDRRVGELMARDQDRGVHVWSGYVAPQVLPDELHSADRFIAAITGVVSRRACAG